MAHHGEAGATPPAEAQVHFSPGEDCLGALVQELLPFCTM